MTLIFPSKINCFKWCFTSYNDGIVNYIYFFWKRTRFMKHRITSNKKMSRSHGKSGKLYRVIHTLLLFITALTKKKKQCNKINQLPNPYLSVIICYLSKLLGRKYTSYWFVLNCLVNKSQSNCLLSSYHFVVSVIETTNDRHRQIYYIQYSTIVCRWSHWPCSVM